MTYRTSKTRRAFDHSIEQIAKVIKASKANNYTIDHKEYIHAAAVFLAHAEVENYFSDVLDDLAKLYSKHSSNSQALPKSLRAHLLLTKSNMIRLVGEKIAGGSEVNLIEKISTHLCSTHAFAADSSYSIAGFSGKDIYQNQKYPSPENIEKVLARIGIKNASNNINRVARKDAVALFESVASLRTALAHNASLPGMSQQDIVNRIMGAKIFVAALDRLLFEHLKTTHTAVQWKNEMT